MSHYIESSEERSILFLPVYRVTKIYDGGVVYYNPQEELQIEEIKDFDDTMDPETQKTIFEDIRHQKMLDPKGQEKSLESITADNVARKKHTMSTSAVKKNQKEIIEKVEQAKEEVIREQEQARNNEITPQWQETLQTVEMKDFDDTMDPAIQETNFEDIKL